MSSTAPPWYKNIKVGDLFGDLNDDQKVKLEEVMELLPDALSANRRKWQHTCLLAKLYRLPVFLHFSEILPYRTNLHLRDSAPHRDRCLPLLSLPSSAFSHPTTRPGTSTGSSMTWFAETGPSTGTTTAGGRRNTTLLYRAALASAASKPDRKTVRTNDVLEAFETLRAKYDIDPKENKHIKPGF
ncbi:hypothetical protein PG994_015097 [Apiospora phragmitis]|uniref:Uncharacterized protein n=1 Tax=Apiospora phragmitis TaxID=2905665 RepID=A0ABR1SXB4_9PEZI